MVEIKDNLQAKLDKHYYPLIELGASIRGYGRFANEIINFDTTDQLRENIMLGNKTESIHKRIH
jgi:hypothetical protein